MRQYLSAEEYISEVQSHIRWKRARKIATLELADHIEDRKEALMANGFDEDAAMSATIADMGNPRTIGMQLDEVYQPKVNFLLIELTAAFLILGTGISYLSGNILHFNQIVAILIGVCLTVIFYFWDYTVMLRHPFTIYFTHTFVTVVLLIFEARNGFETISYSYTFYILILFPISLTVIFTHVKNKYKKFGMFIFACYSLVPFFAAFLLSSLPAMVIILSTYIILVCFGLHKHCFSLSFTEIVILFCLSSVVVIGMWFMYTIFRLKSPFINTGDDFVRKLIFDTVHLSKLSGSSDFCIIYDKEQFLKENYPFVLILNKYGYFGVGFVIALFVGLLTIMFYTADKQKTEIGKMIAGVTYFIISFQLFCSIICNFWYLGSMSVCIPFLFSGGVFTVVDLILIGLVLSVSRHEEIVREWIQYKERKN